MSDENSKFRILVKKYRNHFGLSQENVANLFKGKRSDYEGVETGKRTIDLNLANKIANAYGLTYCQMIDPIQVIPPFDKLPTETQKVISEREMKGLVNRDYDNDIAGNLDRIIHETKVLHQPVTAEEIRLNFPEEIRDTIKATRITDLLKKSGRDEIVIQVNKKGREHLFQLRELVKK